jgi:hypothetical protein
MTKKKRHVRMVHLIGALITIFMVNELTIIVELKS